MEKFDLIVIGTGSAGSSVAHKCKKAGWSVAIVDVLPFGGTCALRGCDPKKVLIGAVELVDWSRRMQSQGVLHGNSTIDWRGLMDFKKTFTENVPASREASFAKAGIKTFYGKARFIDKNTLEIGDIKLTAKYFHIATGAKPARLNIKGEEHLINSTEFLNLKQLAQEIAFVGGGYIGFEFAHIVARCGSAARIIHRGNRPLETFDKDLVGLLTQASRDAGIEISLSTTVNAVEKSGSRFAIHTSGEGRESTIYADLVVHAAGRTPDVEDLNLEAAGVEYSKHGVRVNEFMQSVSNPNVYAAGDAADSRGLPLTPVAAVEGRIAASNLLKGNHLTANYTGTSSVVFTVPPLAAVGMTEESAAEKGFKYKIKYEETSGWYSSRRLASRWSAYKTIVDEETGRILGAHLLGFHAEEVINLFALAIRFGLTAKELRTMIFAYPTAASDINYML
jgi:glutathione reductase (NADPH)